MNSFNIINIPSINRFIFRFMKRVVQFKKDIIYKQSDCD